MSNENSKFDAERAAFEAHYHRYGLDKDPISGAYFDSELRCLWDAWQARASLPVAGSAVEVVEVVEFHWPEYHSQGMGCGLEDRGITDRYEAMQYGWDCAIDRCAEIVPDEPLMTVAQHERIVAALSAQQPAPERVSVPRDLLADLISGDHDTKIQAERALYALLASHAEGGKV